MAPRFFRFPWATSGDRAAVPFDVDPGGAVSFAQCFGPDYEIAPGDPGWKPVPRDETNGLYYDLTDNIRQYQVRGVPDWYDATNNAGVAINYEVNAVVRHNDVIYKSLVANNTVTPGTDVTKWAVEVSTEASLAEAIVAVNGTNLITPRRLGSAVQRGAWNYAAAGGTANDLTVTLTPAPAAYAVGLRVLGVTGGAPNAGNMTIDVNGLGVRSLLTAGANQIIAGQLPAGTAFEAYFDGTAFRIISALPATAAMAEQGTSLEAYLTPAGVFDRRNPYFISSGGATQSIPVGVSTRVTNLSPPGGGASFFNSGSSFGSAQFTCGTKDAGAWIFTGYAGMTLTTDTTAGKDFRISLARNGTAAGFVSSYVDEASVYGVQTTNAFVLSPGDVISLNVFQNTQSVRNIASTQLFGMRLGAS